jgi:hypothetical protein
VKLHGLARVKNEGDVIEEFVRHNLRFLDGLTVVDNASFDGTLEVLEALRSEGLPLTIHHDPMLQKRQYETVTQAARESANAFGWDFLFVLDGDEFIKGPGRAEVERSLAALPRGWNGLLRWVTYVPTSEDDAAEPRVLKRIAHRRAAESEPAQLKVVVSRACAADPAFTVMQGNHAAFGACGHAPSAPLEHVALAHFPVRSAAQLQGKALLGWGAYLAMGEDQIRNYGWHQRRLFERLESGGAFTDRELPEIALGYTEQRLPALAPALVYDPLPPVPEHRYGNAAITDPARLAARYVRQLARAVARANQAAMPPREPLPTTP